MAASAPSLNPPAQPGAPSPAPHPVKTPPPHRPGIPGATSEPTSTLSNLRARGNYPSTGIYDGMRRQIAAIDSAMTARFYRAQGRPWRAQDKPGITGTALARSQRVRRQLNRLWGGLPGIAAEFLDRADQFGFGMAHRKMAVDQTGEFGLVRLVWVESWQVWRWIVDDEGFPVGVELKGATGAVREFPIDMFALYARRGNERLPEGHPALRCLHWPTEDIRRMLVNAAKARDRIGLGKRLWKIPAAQITSPDSVELRSAIVAAEAELDRSEERYAIIPEEAQYEWDEGPRLEARYQEAIRGHEHSIARQFGDTMTEEGTAIAGARAAVVEQHKAADVTEKGQCDTVARAMTRELVWPIYAANGWPREEAPDILPPGFLDTDALRALMEVSREDRERALAQLPTFLEDADIDGIRQQMRTSYGWGADHV